MIAIIGGPSKDEPKGGKPSFMMKPKPKKIGGIGGDYANEPEDSEGSGMSNEEKMLEAARPLARAMGVPSSSVVEAVTTIFNLLSNEKPASEEPAESEEEEG